MYVDDLNLVRTLEELIITMKHLKKEFEMKDLGKTIFCFGLQIEYFPIGVLVHQSTYTKKILKCFNMDKTHHLSSPMVVRSLDMKNDHFVIVRRVNNYLVLKYHALVSLVYLCILLTVLAQILLFMSSY